MNLFRRATLVVTFIASLSAPSWAADEETPTDSQEAQTPEAVTTADAVSVAPKSVEPAPTTPKIVEAVPAGPVPRTGFSMNVGLSLATCLPSGEADCSNTYPGPSLSAAMEVRFWYLGVALEYDYGWHVVGGAGSENVSSTTMHLTPVLKGYYPMDNLEVFLGLGLGYSSMSVSESSSESLASWTTLWQGTKLSGGIWYDLAQWGMPEGVSLDVVAHLFLNFGGERCTEYAGSGPCLSGEDLKASQRDVAQHLQLGSALRYTF